MLDDVGDMTGNAKEEGPLERTQSSDPDLGPVNKRTRTQKYIDIADKVGASNVFNLRVV